MRFLASWKMVVFELALGVLASVLAIASYRAEAPMLNLVAMILLAITGLLLAASLLVELLPIAASIWQYRSSRREPLMTLEDPVFGVLEFGDGIWASAPKNPVHDVPITIDAPETGPCDLQRDFFRSFVERRANYEKQAKAFILTECGKLDLGVDAAALRLYACDIDAENELEDGKFVLEFVEADEIVVHRVVFRDHKPHEYGMDD